MRAHNPDGLTPEQVGVSKGWRLLDADEIFGDSIKEIESYGCLSERWHDDGREHGRMWSVITYRTRLTRAELREARGLPEEKPHSPACNGYGWVPYGIGGWEPCPDCHPAPKPDATASDTPSDQIAEIRERIAKPSTVQRDIESALSLIPVDTKDPLTCLLRNTLIECRAAVASAPADLAFLLAEVERLEREKEAEWIKNGDIREELEGKKDVIGKLTADLERVTRERDEARKKAATYRADFETAAATADKFQKEAIAIRAEFSAERDAARAEVERLKVAFNAARAFIDSHAADPDITEEMTRRYADYIVALANLEERADPSDIASQVAELKEDAARLDWLESATWNDDRIGNGIVIAPYTLTATNERRYALQALGGEGGSNLGEELENGNTLRAAIDAARK